MPLVNPPATAAQRLSDIHLHVRDRAQELAQGGAAEGLPQVRDHQRSVVRAGPRLPGAAAEHRPHDKQVIAKIGSDQLNTAPVPFHAAPAPLCLAVTLSHRATP